MSSTGASVVNGSVTHLQQYPLQSGNFIKLAILFFILALVTAAVGASGVAGVSMTIAKWFVIIFLVLAILSFVL
ncbi:DUF1328 domain-containing protein [Halovenus halobia]|uniref:DUF1328 domain-containing protein n=1 Tax=Halovenus halobia TaxID=3396622 RepID=UPI003F5432B6